MNTSSYLKRINYSGDQAVTLENLKALQRAHLLAVPFENLDIHMKRPITLNHASIYKKIVENKRGGFCFELNGLFSWLLSELGYEVALLRAQVVNKEGQLGHEFGHLALMVTLDAQRWLVDVGFGYSFEEPLSIDSVFTQTFGKNAYRWRNVDNALMLQINENGVGWQDRYQFTVRPHEYEDFSGGCHYHQTSPQSHFTQGRICSQATTNGRITLSDDKFVVTTNGEKIETAVSDEETFRNLLLQQFGIHYQKAG